MAFGILSLKGRALRYLAQREYSRAELQRKLWRHLQRTAALAQQSARGAAEARARAATENAAEGLAEDATATATAAGAVLHRARNPIEDRVAALWDTGATSDAPPQLDKPDAASEVAAVLDALSLAGLLSDERAAESVVSRQSPRFGERRLRQSLQAKGLGKDLVASSLQAVRATEFERAWQLWQRRFGGMPADAGQTARQQRFLAGRGFDGTVIRQVFKAASQAEPDA